MTGYFEAIPLHKDCEYCAGRRLIVPLPRPMEAVYCISLQEQPHRTGQAVAHFHNIGLCRHVTFYRPTRGRNAELAIWESHRAVAHHALANGRKCALILEDDVDFRQPWSKLASRVQRAIAQLPSNWWSLYLGHVPLQAHFAKLSILRVRSLCAHAYVASPRLLAWLDATEPFSPEIAMWRRFGESIDCAMANLPGMYALFPMAVLQRFLGDYRVNTRVDISGRPRSWRDIDRWRYYFIFRGARIVESLAVLLSPFHRLTIERYRRRSQNNLIATAQLIQASGLFDGRYYLQSRPDVAAREINPLGHYLYHGAKEGSWPSPLFDPHYYATQCPHLGDENPLAHFIRIGGAQGHKPHPLFDINFYVSRHGQWIPKGVNPLAHFITDGGITGCDPHPLFDCKWYLAQYPELRDSRQNPLIHYLTEGRRQGASPHPQFDGDLYLQCKPAVRRADNAAGHFVRHE